MPLWFIVPWLIPLGLWLLWSGWSAGVGIRIAIGATLLFVAAVVLGAILVSSRMGDRRLRRKPVEGVVTEVDLPPSGGSHRVAVRKGRTGDDDNVGGSDSLDGGGGAFDSDVGSLD
ncbi:MAG: hypothetical protein ACFCUT_09465 [Kiloniellaceae bacterium]